MIPDEIDGVLMIHTNHGPFFVYLLRSILVDSLRHGSYVNEERAEMQARYE